MVSVVSVIVFAHLAAAELPVVTFSSGQAQLSDDQRAALVLALPEIQTLFAGDPSLLLQLEGHTDTVGNADTNRLMSEQRAIIVRDTLVSLNVPAARLRVLGHGPFRPIADNLTEEGRRKNRRVELVLVHSEVATKGSVAVLAHKMNQVNTRELLAEWRPAVVNEELYVAWRVGALQRSGAVVRFTRVPGSLDVRERSVVIIFGPDERVRSAGTVTLENGSLKARLAELRGAGKSQTVAITSKAAQAEVESADVVVTHNQRHTAVANHKGKGVKLRSAVKDNGATVAVEEGFGSRVEPGKDPTPPEPLPKAPALSNDDVTITDDGNFVMRLHGGPRIAHYLVEVKDTQGALVASEMVSAPRYTSAGLSPGVYTVTASAIDDNDLESLPSSPLTINTRTTTKTPTAEAPGAKAPTVAKKFAPSASPTTSTPSKTPSPYRVGREWSVFPFAVAATIGARTAMAWNDPASVGMTTNQAEVFMLGGTTLTAMFTAVGVMILFQETPTAEGDSTHVTVPPL